METYKEFLDRISSFEKKQADFGKGYFRVNPSVAQKVNPDNSFKKFYGDTVVFALDGKIKKILEGYTDLLYSSAPQCFCERLTSDTFHVTLHDLINSPAYSEVEIGLRENELKIRQLTEDIKKHANTTIRMKSKYVFNMVNTSIVLGLYPANERGYARLIELYGVFDGVKKLNYSLTPHITLAYYNADGFDAPSARILEDTVNRLNNDSFEFDLNVNDLYYQHFTSMNDYTDVIRLTDCAK